MPRIEHKMVGVYHVFTSPDVPGLYVAHRDEETARNNVQPTIDAMQRMSARQRTREQLMRPAAE